MTLSSRILPAFALVAAMFTFNTGTGLGPGAVWAQAAGDLRCSGCVDRRDIRRGAVTFSRLQGKVRNRITDLESAAAQRLPFFITLDGDGAEQTLVTNGALTIFARCRVNDVGEDRVEIIFTSSIAGWFAETDRDSGENGPLVAFEEVVALEEERTSTTTGYDNDAAETSAIAPDGSFMAIIGEATGLGVNVFGHDCLAIGNVFLINGTT